MAAKALLVCFVFPLLVFFGCIGQLEKAGCDYLPADDNKDHCYQDAAVRMGDPATCERIVGYKFAGENQNPPKDKCYLRIAIDKKDPSICSNLVGGMNGYFPGECYQEVAVAAKDPKICDMMGGFNISRGFGAVVVSKEACYSLVGSQPTYCAGLSGELESGCFANESIKTSNPLLCERVRAKPGQYACLLEYASLLQNKVMMDEGSFDSSECGGFVDTNMRYMCAFLGAGVFDQPSACGIIRETNFRTMCESVGKLVADNATDAELLKMRSDCSTLSDKDLRAVCLLMLGLHENLASSSIEDDEKAAKMEVEGFENMLLACDSDVLSSDNEEIDRFCMGYLLIAEKPEHCDKMKTVGTRDKCYEVASLETGDCSVIRDSKVKAECESVVLDIHKAYFGKCNALQSIPEKDACVDIGKSKLLEQIFGVRMVPDRLRGKY